MADFLQISETDYYVYRVLRALDSAREDLKPLNNLLTVLLTKKFSNVLNIQAVSGNFICCFAFFVLPNDYL